MESNSVEMRIHISDAAALRVAEQDPTLGLKCRGKIPIKGKVGICRFMYAYVGICRHM
jgi:hypothetical protein